MGTSLLSTRTAHSAAPLDAPSSPPELPHLLIVDDENGPRQALRILLKEDYDVHIASNVADALELLRGNEQVGLIITDMRMPKQTGVDLLREAKAMRPDVQVIVLTGYGQLETAMKAVEYGAFSYMEKPFDNEAMLDMVRSGLDKFREEKDRRAMEFLSLEANRFETLGRVVAGIMHDLGSPLTVINSHIELMSMESEVTDLDERLSVMRQQVQHCGDLVRTTMGFLRNEVQGPAPIVLNDEVKACLTVAAPQLRESRVTVETNLASDLPLIKGEGVLIRQIVLNLITNACQALGEMPTRKLRIETWTEGNDACVAVEDTGPGVPQEIRNRIFDTFFSTKGKKGTGLGLSVVRNLMRRHNGSVVLERSDESGARFLLRFATKPTG